MRKLLIIMLMLAAGIAEAKLGATYKEQVSSTTVCGTSGCTDLVTGKFQWSHTFEFSPNVAGAINSNSLFSSSIQVGISGKQTTITVPLATAGFALGDRKVTHEETVSLNGHTVVRLRIDYKWNDLSFTARGRGLILQAADAPIGEEFLGTIGGGSFTNLLTISTAVTTNPGPNSLDEFLMNDAGTIAIKSSGGSGGASKQTMTIKIKAPFVPH